MKAGPIRALDQIRVGLAVRTGTVMFVLMSFALAYWLWIGLTIRGLHFDEGISILAAQGILEHGYALLPSGFFYDRGYFYHYLLAFSMLALGLNKFSVMLPSIIFGLGSLLLVYRLAKDVLGRPWLGIAAGVLLLLLDTQAWYATSPRMYMSFQFFSLLAIYCTYRGFIRDEGRFKILAVLGIIGAIYSHEQGLLLVLILPAAALAVMLVNRDHWTSIISFQNVLSVLVIGVAAILILMFKPQPYPAVVIHDSIVPARVGLNLSLSSWIKHIFYLERTLPYGLVLLPLAYFNLFAFKASEKQHIYSHNLLFLLAVFTFTFVTTGLVVRDGVSERLFIFVLPIYTLLASVGGMTLVQSLIANYSNGMKLSRAWPVAVLLLIFGVSASVALSTVQHVLNLERGPVAERTLTSFLQRPNPVALAEVGYGLPANKPGIPSGEGPAMLHQKLQQSLAAEDLLVSDTPMYANYLLRRPDAYLRQRLVNGETLVGFDSPTDEYFGIQLIDTLEELQLLKTSQQRTWIIVQNDPSHLSQEFLSYLESSFVKYYQNQFGIVYVNSPLDSGGLYQLDR